MEEKLSNEDLMDIITSYDRYVQDICSRSMIPVTVAEFYENLYKLYSMKQCSQYIS